MNGDKNFSKPGGGQEAHSHEAAVKAVSVRMPDAQSIEELSGLFKLFGDASRLRILCALSISELCVCAISQLLGMTQSAVSHQLAQLRKSKLVTYRRDGKTLYYSLADSHVRTIIAMGEEHIEE